MHSHSPSPVLFRLWIVAAAVHLGMNSGLALAQDASRVAHAGAVTNVSRTVHIAGAPDTLFDSIQSAIDAAKDGDSIQIGEGRFDERLKVYKPITLHGAGADKTVLGPTLGNQVQLREQFEEFAGRVQSGKLTEEERKDPAKLQKHFEQQFKEYSSPVIEIKDVVGVELRSLRITLPDTPRKGKGLKSSQALSINHAGVKISDCAVVGCMDGGIHATNGSDLTVKDSLIAGVWGTGIAMFSREPGRLRISDSEIRNCYHINIWTGPYSDPCIIERCRISGSAWFGIRYGDKTPVIEHNLIFDNARAGIYIEGDEGAIQGNVFYRNASGGVACYYTNKARIEKNLFVENQQTAIWVNGNGEPVIHGNVFLQSPRGVSYGPLTLGKTVLQPAGKYDVRDNYFWNIETPIVLRDPVKPDGSWDDHAVEMVNGDNQLTEPKLSRGPEGAWQVDDSSPVRQLGFDQHLAKIPFKSRWPITDEETAMIPDGPTRDWSQWKMRP